MRIVHVLPVLAKGGGERVVTELANHAVNAGHDVTVILGCPSEYIQAQNEFDSKVQIQYVSNSAGSRLRRYLGIFTWLGCHRSWLAEQDVLHCHLSYGMVFGTIVGFWRKLSGVVRPVVVETYHSVGMNIPPLHRWIHAQLLLSRDALVLMAEDEYWNRFVAKHPKLYSKVIPNGIRPSKNDADVDIQRAHREKLGIPNSCCFVVGTVCMLRPDRKPWLYIPIFDQVARVLGPEVHFVIAGGGAELDRMRSLVIEHGLEGRVHLPGLDLNPDLTRSIMDLYITLNVGPLTGIAAMEAASVALPVLAIQLRNDYENTPNDWIWSSADPKEVVEKIIHLIRSPQERREIADRQKAYIIANHTIEAVANSYQTLYQTAIKTKMSDQ